MNLMKKLSSKNFLVFNLVLVGVIFGFFLAFVSFSCSTPRVKNVARAQEGPSSPVVIPQDALAAAEGLQSAFSSVADKVLPSVVEIKTVSVQRRQTPNFNGIPWEFFFGPREGSPNREQDREFRSAGLGSGIIVRQDKDTYYVLTNNHVVDGANEIQAATKDGKEYPAELVGKDSRRDLAVVSFKTSDFFPPATLGNSDNVKVGDWAIAMGNPLGEQFSFSVTMGIVSAVGRTGGPGGNINDFIQTDAPINQGNSGGPLVNIRGEVIGINTWIASNNGGGSVGLGFAIPINNVKRSIDEFIKSGNVNDGWLGVSLTDADRETLQILGLEGKRGALVSQVFQGSPADKAGIRPGDFITHIDNREARGVNPLTQMVGDIRPNEKAVFTLIRDGASRNFEVRIETRTDEVAADNKKLWPGVYIVSLSDAIRSSLKLDKGAEGVYVLQVLNETPAAVIGMQRGDRITAVNDTPVKDIATFYKALREKADRELWFTFVRGDATLESLKVKR
ncbi:MAG: Do family serine endopeptidase [Treponema sp.]|jgi:Do/DeqQ family serine protease|nr:Do family serine endopeptidase [Treponema sp.]